MIREISIANYKTISQLTFELGRVNVLIGANGCGKSNILEAITFGSAAVADKLDNEFLANRGIRIGDPRQLLSGFDKANLDRPIELAFTGDDGIRYGVSLSRINEPYAGWAAQPDSLHDVSPKVQAAIKRIKLEPETLRALMQLLEQTTRVIEERIPFWADLRRFLTYAPQTSTLRQLEHESPIEPLGLHGEGLFRLLRVLESKGALAEVNEALAAIDWFDGLALVGDSSTDERRIQIVDQYLDPEFPELDQRSANEGFLFFLFYVALLVSRHTPRFCAVENVDESLNPRLCVHLVKTITGLAARHEKQVILTTHNPAALDGLDLDDDEQRLFVVSRNADGHTHVRRVRAADRSEHAVRLSEAFIRGYLGGLPTSF